MLEPKTTDWERLRALCVRAGLPPKRVDRLEKCWSERPSDGGRLTLLAGSPKTMALVLRRWLDLDTENARLVAAGTVLVIGPNPDSIHPPPMSWPGVVRSDVGSGHILIIPSTGAVPAPVRSGLNDLGIADQLVLFSSLPQAPSREDRELANSMALSAAIARVVIVAVPSQEVTELDHGELVAHATAQMESNGFLRRFLGAGVWFTEGERPGYTIQNLNDCLTTPDGDTVRGRSAAIRASISNLLSEIDKLRDESPDKELSIQDADELCRRFRHHVSILGTRLNELVAKGEFPDTDACRKFVSQSLLSWAHGPSQEGFLLNESEQARPGIGIEFQDQAIKAANELHYVPPPPQPVGPSVGQFPLTTAIVVAVVAAVLSYGVGSLFLRDWILVLVAGLCAGAVFLGLFAQSKLLLLSQFWGGHTLGILKTALPVVRWFVRPQKSESESSPPAPQPLAMVQGWATAELILTNWFNGRIGNVRPTLHQECEAIRSQLQLEG